MRDKKCDMRDKKCEIEYCEIPGRAPSSRNLTHDNMAGSGDNDEEVCMPYFSGL